MRKARRSLFALIILVSLAAVGYKIYDSINSVKREIKKNPIKALEYLPESALNMKDFRRAKIEDGRKVWEIFGEEANYFKEEKRALIKKPRFSYFDKKGEPAHVVGDLAKLFFNDKELERMELEGKIVVTYQGYVLKSEEAVYLPDKQQILLPRPTTIASDGLESEGSSMEVELEEKKVRMLRNVKTKIEPAKLEANQKKTKMRQVTGE